MKIDSHQHFWHYNPQEYGWVKDDMEVLKNDFLPARLLSELQALSFDGSIAVQARQTLEETEWLLQLASKYDFIKGIVGWVDLCSADIDEQLKKYSANPKFIGVRHVIHDEPDDSFILRPEFENGISKLQKYNLTYDLLIFPKHLPLTIELVRKFPQTKFILDHIAKPDIKGQIKEPWATLVFQLAQLPNVFCKLSGMVTEAAWKQWKESDFSFYLETVYKAFGPDRLMIGSDWPVCLLSGSYKDTVNVVNRFMNSLPHKDKEKISGINCVEIYYLKRGC